MARYRENVVCFIKINRVRKLLKREEEVERRNNTVDINGGG